MSRAAPAAAHPSRRRAAAAGTTVAALAVVMLLGAARHGQAGSPPARSAPVSYEIAIPEPAGHAAVVTVRLARAPAPLEVAMAAWSPGAYRLVHHARFVTPLDAHGAGGRALAWTRLDEDRFRIDGTRAGETVTLRYRVLCERLTEDGCFIEAGHAYLNGPPVFLYVPALRDAPAQVRFAIDPAWRVVCALPPGRGGNRTATDFDRLVDGPCELGTIATARGGPDAKRPGSFFTASAPWALGSDVVLARSAPRPSVVVHGTDARTALDVAALLGTLHARLAVGFDLTGPYTLFIEAGDELRLLGLEHAASATLVLPRSVLAHAHKPRFDDLAWLIAHELVHVVNGKRLRPVELGRYDYLHEQKTPLLWFTEGGTEYLAYRLLLAARAIDGETYLQILADELARVAQAPARESLEAESLALWQRPDRPTETESVIYARAHVVAALVDLELRAHSGGSRSLDSVITRLLARPARDGVVTFDRAALRDAVADAGGPEAAALFERWTRDPGPIDPGPTLARLGLRLDLTPGRALGDAGFETERREGGLVVLTVRPGAAADSAGLRPGDRVLSVAGAAADDGWEARAAAAPPGTRLAVVVAGAAGPIERTVVLGERRELSGRLVEIADSPARAAWLRP